LKSLGVRLSRTRIINLIEDGRVLVNGRIEKPSYKVKKEIIFLLNMRYL